MEILIIYSVALATFFVALYFDLRIQKIPNKLSFTALFTGVVINFIVYGVNGVGASLAGVFVAFILFFPAFYFKILGAGDVKLMMAIGALLGPVIIGWSIAYAIIFGGVTSILLTIYKTGFVGIKNTFIRYYQCFLLRKYFKPEEGEAASLRVPYAPALFLGWILACYQNEELMLTISAARNSLNT